MKKLSRRRLLELMSATAVLSPAMVLAQTPPASTDQPSGSAPPQTPPQFVYDDVVRRARELGAVPYEPNPPALPEPLSRLDYDGYRDIRFRPERSLLAQGGGQFRMQMFHPGFLFKRPVTVNIIREGVPTPVPYSAQLFDYGRNKFDKPLPVNTGFAGFRLHYPLNDPRVHDELIAFLGASYFRFLGRDQRYGLSARGLAINAGGEEEFPFFREFWIDNPAPGADRVVIYALLDSASITGAFQFLVYPSKETVVDVTATLFPRKTINKLGIAPLTSMYYVGENDRRFLDEYRPELHDSDGLLIHSGTGEWIWRPLRNPRDLATSAFVDNNLRGFGLLQRDRIFEHYQDLDLHYELRPGYWVEPRGNWGEGHVELVEIPTNEETNDNIVASWVPRAPAEPGQTLVYRYRITSLGNADQLHPGGRALNTYQTKPKAAGSPEEVKPGTRRFLIDFAGDDLAYFARDPNLVEIDASLSSGRVVRTYLVPNPKVRGLRAAIDIEVEPGQQVDIRAFLRSGSRALTETWIFPWKAE
ncbi:MAG: glucan biosynthesis protein G [Chelatococcus sp.]|uniref:glucan biosynthesis protein n=1 Tax=unclassified Chelatococcus TaxID=2638111 RepID=UPI001BCC633A|nr:MULTISPECIES: glucan biosynthesis protein G [unclassified Chelatococcus]MBS7741605.1 glucan biosynthesis protein G [Chelatococcus sp. HY11]MBX3536306.1 glucan biosynthesis protein G [Chelatococcus sp.]MBX3544376.1 glucan biosynthesis protein G [Chelatococcus sp.]MCO5079100.1 glucan biosynthesis protein G [Chelatococcus sp.]